MRAPLTNYSTWMSTRAAPDPLQHARGKSFSKQREKTVISPHAMQAGMQQSKIGFLDFLKKVTDIKKKLRLELPIHA